MLILKAIEDGDIKRQTLLDDLLAKTAIMTPAEGDASQSRFLKLKTKLS